MYLDNVILFSLIVIAAIIYMMYYIWKYAKKHIEMDTKTALHAKQEAKGHITKTTTIKA